MNSQGDNDEETNVPPGDSSAGRTKGDNDASDQPPAKRVVVTDDTPMGRIDSKSDDTLSLWKRIGLPLGGSRELDRSSNPPQDPPRSVVEKRIVRGAAGILRGELEANRDFGPEFWSRVDDEHRQKIEDALNRLDLETLNLSTEAIESLGNHTAFALTQLIATRNKGGPDATKILGALEKAAFELLQALNAVEAHPKLGSSFDIRLWDRIRSILVSAGVKLLPEVDESKASDMKTLIYRGSLSNIIRLLIVSVLMPVVAQMKRILNNSIQRPENYNFASQIARVWLHATGRRPTGNWAHDDLAGNPAPIRDFAHFVLAVDPDIGTETIRSIISVYKKLSLVNDDKNRNDLTP